MFVFFYLLGTLTLPINGLRVPGVDLGVSELAFFIAFGALVFERINRRVLLKEWLPAHPFWISAGLILVGGLFSTVTAVNPALSLFVTLKAVFVFSIWIALGVVMIAERRQEKLVIIAFCLLPVVSSFIAIWDSLTHSHVGASLAGLVGNTPGNLNLVRLGSIYGRYSGILGHPNFKSELTVVMIPLFLVGALFALRTRQWRRGAAFSVLSIVVIWANWLTGSVAGLVCVITAFAVVLLIGWLREFPRTFVPIGFFAVGAAVLLLLVATLDWSLVTPFLDRITENSNIARALTKTGPSRLELLLAAAYSIMQNPVTGFGMDWLTGDGRGLVEFAGEGVHNGIFRAWLYGGVFVFIGVVYAYVRALGLSARAIRRYLGGQRDWLVLGLGVSIIAWTLFDMTTPSFYQRYTWITAPILFGLLYWTEPASKPSMPEPMVEQSLAVGTQ